LEVVFASSDNSIQEMHKYMGEAKMPWLCFGFQAQEMAALNKKYEHN
jgi:hypothetical protein